MQAISLQSGKNGKAMAPVSRCKRFVLPLLLAIWLAPGGNGLTPYDHSYSWAAEPPLATAFTPLPPGAVVPKGWLRDWALAARDGITGHLDELHPVFEHSWKGYPFEAHGARQGYPLEQGAYWLDGAVRLALVLHDDGLLNRVRARLDPVVDAVLKNQTTLIYWQDRKVVDGNADGGVAAFHSWAHSHMARALLAYYQGTGDRRILEALRIAYSDYPLAETMNALSWGVPAEVNVDPMLETYRLTGDRRLLEQVLAFAGRPSLPKRYDAWRQADDVRRCAHGVCFIEGSRVPALLYPWTGQRWMLDSAVEAFDWAQRRHGLPPGVPSSEELLAGIGAFRCIETCNVPCWIWSHVWLLRVSGQARFGDRGEQAFFNAGPAPIARDWQTMCYYQSPNRISQTLPGAEPSSPPPGGSFRFTPTGHETTPISRATLCCVGNVNRLIPNYIIHMWMATPDKGLAATLYGPCAVTTKTGEGIPVELVCETNYPFEEEIRIAVEPERASQFPLYFRVPQWCAQPQVKIGQSFEPLRPDTKGFAKITRGWDTGDRLTLRFPMPPQVVQGRESPYPQHKYFKRVGSKQTQVENPFASVYAGPLLFALPIPDKDANTVAEGADWQYALDFDGQQDGSDLRIERRAMPPRWSWQLDAPVAIRAPARRFDWQPTDEQPLPASPVAGGESQIIRLVPYGCAKFRVSMFPVTPRAWQGK